MQSGCDATLKRMNRKYDSARYYESVTLLREHFDRPGITTDLIVGFPGETEEEFDQTLAVLFEEEKEGLWRGHAPNYTEVFAPGEGLHNVIKEVKITGIHRDGLKGSVLE